MKNCFQSCGVLFLLIWPLSVLNAQAFRDSTLTYVWIKALAEQPSAELNPAVLSLTQSYVHHFPKSLKNSEILQIQGGTNVKAGKPYRAFVGYLKQLTLYPDSTRDYISKKALIQLVLNTPQLRNQKKIVATYLAFQPSKMPFCQRYGFFISRLYWLDVRKIDTIALAEINQFLACKPDKKGVDEILYEKAHILQRNHLPRKALLVYASILRDWPHSEYVPLSLYHMGQIFEVDLNRKQLARAVLRTFVQRFPGHYLAPYAYFHLAELAEASHSFQIAALDYAQFLKQSREKPLRALGYYQLGRLYEKELKDKNKAGIFYARYRALYATPKEAKRALKTLRQSWGD